MHATSSDYLSGYVLLAFVRQGRVSKMPFIVLLSLHHMDPRKLPLGMKMTSSALQRLRQFKSLLSPCHAPSLHSMQQRPLMPLTMPQTLCFRQQKTREQKHEARQKKRRDVMQLWRYSMQGLYNRQIIGSDKASAACLSRRSTRRHWCNGMDFCQWPCCRNSWSLCMGGTCWFGD